MATPEGQVPEPEAEAPAEAPWWQAGGWDAEPDVHQLRQHQQYYNAMQDRNTRDFYLEQTLRSGNELPEGMSLAEAKEILRAAHKQANDPWAQAYQEPEVDEGPQFDITRLPDIIDQRVNQTVEQRINAYQQQQAQETANRQAEQDFNAELGRFRDQNGLDDRELGMLRNHAISLAQQPNATFNSVKDVVSAAYKDMEAVRDHWLATAAERQLQAPQRISPAGPSTTTEALPKNLREVVERLQR